MHDVIYVFMYTLHISLYIYAYCQLGLKRHLNQGPHHEWPVLHHYCPWRSAQWPPRGFGATPWSRVRAISGGGGMGIVCNVIESPEASQINNICSPKRVILYVLAIPDDVESQT